MFKNEFNLTTGISLVPAGIVYGKGSASGTIELLRVHGNLHMSCLGRLTNRQVVSSGLIWGPTDSAEKAIDAATIFKLNEGAADFSTDFHVFSTEWSPKGIHFFVDGKLVEQLQIPKTGLWKLTMDNGNISNKQNHPYQPVSLCTNKWKTN